MRIDEHGRWVSDDGSYIWDEAAQTWQPSAPHPTESTISGAVVGDAGIAGGSVADDVIGDVIGDVAPADATGEFAVGHPSQGTSGWSVSDETPLPGAAWSEPVQADARDTARAGVDTLLPSGQGGPGGWPFQDGDTRIGVVGTDTSVATAYGSSWQGYPFRESDPGMGPATSFGTVDASATSEIAQPGEAVQGLPGPFGVVDVISLGPSRDGGAPGSDTGTDELGSHPRAPAGARSQHRRRRAGRQASAARSGPGGHDVSPEPAGRMARVLSSVTVLPRRVLIGTAAVLMLLVGVGGYLIFGGGGGDVAVGAPVEATAGPSTGAVTGGPLRYSEPLRTAYLQECMQVSNGLRAYCTCTLEKLEAGYPQDQYEALNKNVNSPETTRIIREISDQCVSA
ncbi:hypothetical protein FDG2_5732 [Candidatus Protofrankia californiensis]|uniref:Uncharacterized protein n=1 Tax=Candidatus Protofrankia californiensis TaxID=1839754 RepID=A0A1C3PFE6_9ACTN|nr:hypothetical protein FDG2_5732 [Candidatus Protofrankia californiensis]